MKKRKKKRAARVVRAKPRLDSHSVANGRYWWYEDRRGIDVVVAGQIARIYWSALIGALRRCRRVEIREVRP